jgi:hypothetical protein
MATTATLYNMLADRVGEARARKIWDSLDDKIVEAMWDAYEAGVIDGNKATVEGRPMPTRPSKREGC